MKTNITYKELCLIKAIQILILLIIVLAILIRATRTEAGRRLAEIQQSELEFAVSATAIPDYDHSIFIDLIETNPKSPAFRCGDVVRLKNNNAQIAIVFDSHFDGKEWVYSLLPAHYSQQQQQH